MGERTEIAWTDHTFNAWWGCARVSPACENCYAQAFAKRVGFSGRTDLSGAPNGPPLLWGTRAERRFFGDKHWSEPRKWDRAAERAGERRRVFCASMADVFEEREDLVEPRARLFRLIESTPHLDWLLLTKRAHAMLPLARAAGWLGDWPRNVWAGVTAENAEWSRRRVHHLIEVPAVVRFVSYEPALGALLDDADDDLLEQIDWLIIGGESGGAARPFDLAWAREVIAFCRAAGIAPFMKQLGSDPIDGLAGCEVWQRAAKGDDPNEWPEELRVQEFPEVHP